MRQTQRKMNDKFEYHQPYLVIYHTIILMKQFYSFYLFNAQTRMQTRYIYIKSIYYVFVYIQSMLYNHGSGLIAMFSVNTSSQSQLYNRL